MFFRFATAGASLGLLLSCGSCERPKEPPRPAIGSILGIVSPAGAAARVKATDAARRTYAVEPAPDGSFALHNVPNGDYQLTVEPQADYTEPALGRCLVSFGSTNLDTVLLLPLRPAGGAGLLGYSVGEQGVRFASVTAALSGTQLLLTATRARPGGLPDAEQVLMQLTEFTGPGSYECGRTATVIYQQRPTSGTLPYRWSTATPEGRGTVRITYHDPVARRLAGVFVFEAGAVNSATTGLYHTTNGYFTDVAY